MRFPQKDNRSKKEALVYEREFLNKCKHSTEITFRNLVENYLEDCKIHLKPTTMRNKKFLIDTKLMPYFADKIISEIDIHMVRQWQNELIASESHYAPTYLKTVHNQLSAIFNFAVKYYNLQKNPAALCGSMGKKNAESMQFWTKDEFDRFLTAVSDKKTSRVIFSLLFYSGMREGELLALTLDDFDFQRNTVSITRNYARINNKEIIQTPKTPKSTRLISLPKEILDLVKDYANSIYNYDPAERLFRTSKSSLLREMKRGCARSGVKRIRIHDIRHSHASLLIELGFPPLLIAERLGHENIQTTLNTYSHLYPNKHKTVSDKLSELISDSKHPD